MDKIEDAILEDLYTWIDEVPLSRAKRDIRRDFADGVLVAEVIKHFLPTYVEVHNYPPALGASNRVYNWHTLNKKVFKKLGFELNEDVIQNIVTWKPFAIEQFLLLLQVKIEQVLSQRTKAEQQDRFEDDDPSSSMIMDHQLLRQNILTFNDSASDIPLSSSHSVRSGFHSQPTLSHKQTSAAKSSNRNSGSNRKHAMGEAMSLQIISKKDEQLMAKDEKIEMLQAKIVRLEQLLQLKEIRIGDLQTRLARLKAEKSAPPVRLCRTLNKR